MEKEEEEEEEEEEEKKIANKNKRASRTCNELCDLDPEGVLDAVAIDAKTGTVSIESVVRYGQWCWATGKV